MMIFKHNVTARAARATEESIVLWTAVTDDTGTAQMGLIESQLGPGEIQFIEAANPPPPTILVAMPPPDPPIIVSLGVPSGENVPIVIARSNWTLVSPVAPPVIDRCWLKIAELWCEGSVHRLESAYGQLIDVSTGMPGPKRPAETFRWGDFQVNLGVLGVGSWAASVRAVNGTEESLLTHFHFSDI